MRRRHSNDKQARLAPPSTSTCRNSPTTNVVEFHAIPIPASNATVSGSGTPLRLTSGEMPARQLRVTRSPRARHVLDQNADQRHNLSAHDRSYLAPNMEDDMTQSGLIKKIAELADLSEVAVGRAIKGMTAAIVQTVAAGQIIRIPGLGIFIRSTRPAHRGRNPQTGESIDISATNVLRFRAGKAARAVLNPPPRRPRAMTRSRRGVSRSQPAR
jgi:DNA-binding protein HU-beta